MKNLHKIHIMHAHETTTPLTTMSLLDYTMITFDNMVDRGLDDLENSNNSIIKFMNRRVDEIQEEMKKSREEFYLMQFASMSVMLPIVGITLFMFGGSPILTGMLAMGGPLYLMSFMTDESSAKESGRLLENKNMFI